MKKTKLAAIFTAALCICSASMLSSGAFAADDLTIDGIDWSLPDDTFVTETSGTCGENASWEFNEETGTLTVSGEGELSFTDSAPWTDLHKSIKYAVIEEGITVLPDGTFGLCTKLESVKLPSTLKEIDPNAWMLCPSLSEIVIPKENENFAVVDNVVFSKDMKSLVKYPSAKEAEEYTIPDTVEKIEYMAFTICGNLSKIVISENVKHIDENFAMCRKLTDVSFPSGLEYINYMSFYSTPWLDAQREIDSLVMINNIIFNGTACEGEVIIPENAETIADFAFANNEKITSVTFNDKVSTVSVGAFASCEALEKVVFSDNISRIDTYAFAMTAILNVVVPKTVSYIGADAFSNCENLVKITILDPECEIYDLASTISTQSQLNNNKVIEYYGAIRGYKGSTAEAYAEKYGYSFEEIESVSGLKGDANGDGVLSVADSVVLQKWLLGYKIPVRWENLDLCEDGVLDVFDLVVLRKMLSGKA